MKAVRAIASAGLLSAIGLSVGSSISCGAASPNPAAGTPVSSPSQAPAGRPAGIFAIGLRGGAPSPQLLEMPFVDGVTLAAEWRQLEPAQGAYDFSTIDATLAALEPFGKKLTLGVFSFRVPDYLPSDPLTQTYRVPHIGSAFITPVPWDDRGLARYEALFQALAEHRVSDRAQGGRLVPLPDHRLLDGLHCWVMGMNGIRDIGGLTGQTPPLYEVPNYSRDRLTTGIVRSLHAVVDRFPRQFHYLPFFRISDQTAAPALDRHLLDAVKREFFGGSGASQLGLFQENLSCNAPGREQAFALFEEQMNTYTMLQMLQAWLEPLPGSPGATDRCLVTTVPGNRATATSGPEVGIRYGYETLGARYFEIYQADLLHPGFADEFRTWHAILHP